MKRALVVLLATLALLAPARLARAHGMLSAYLEITEQDGGTLLVRLRSAVPGVTLSPILPRGCRVTEPAKPEATDIGLVHTLVAHCPGALAGQDVGIRGLGRGIPDAVVWLTRADGSVQTRLLTARAPRFTVPAPESGTAIARQYVGLGVRHIASGADHLLFLLLLVLTLRRLRSVLFAETAFTLSHSVSFSATALGWVHVAPEAAEACIALSLVLVALDLGRAGARRPGPREGALIALVFGLVHGLGFAGGLREIGIPDAHIAAALVGFGGGVEIGQVAFVLAVLGVMALLRQRWLERVEIAVAYVAGSIATFWLVARLLLVLHGGAS